MRLRASRRRIISPFPHTVFRNFFPTAFYRHPVRHVPTKRSDPITGTGTRIALRLYGENVGKIEQPLRHEWAAVSTMLTLKAVEQTIRNKLRDGLESAPAATSWPDLTT